MIPAPVPGAGIGSGFTGAAWTLPSAAKVAALVPLAAGGLAVVLSVAELAAAVGVEAAPLVGKAAAGATVAVEADEVGAAAGAPPVDGCLEAQAPSREAIKDKATNATKAFREIRCHMVAAPRDASEILSHSSIGRPSTDCAKRSDE
jgi:hypothetical protein